MHTNSLQARTSPCYFEPWQYFSMGLATNSTTHIEQALLELQQKGGLVEDGDDISHNMQEVDYKFIIVVAVLICVCKYPHTTAWKAMQCISNFYPSNCFKWVHSVNKLCWVIWSAHHSSKPFAWKLGVMFVSHPPPGLEAQTIAVANALCVWERTVGRPPVPGRYWQYGSWIP